jgi:hypothetical protein
MRGLWVADGLSVPVEIVDTRERFGVLDYQIHPTGTHEKNVRWVESLKVALFANEQAARAAAHAG